MGRHGTAVVFGTLDGAAEALSVGVAGGQGGDHLAVQKDGLGVVAAGVIVLVCG